MSTLFRDDEYKPRIIDSQVEEYLDNCGAICIEGPKWCGKTWTSAKHSKSEFFVGNPDNGFSNRILANERPSLVLKGAYPRMIDEWQEAPCLWDAARAEADKLNKNGLFILTGSSTPKRKGILHSGTGRIISLRMTTMSLFESGASSGSVSLEKLCSGELEEQMTGEVSLENIADCIVRGGWPKNISAGNPLLVPRSYVQGIIDSNLADSEEDYHYSAKRIELILKSLARNESTTASTASIARDITEIDGEVISEDTVSRYLEAMNRAFITLNQAPYSPEIRSSLRVKQAEKRHFSDPAMACALLNITPSKLMSDLNTFGFLFESLVERDLFVYAQSFGGKLYHYQDYRNNEIDAVIELENGDWCAFEIKLGARQIEIGAGSLNKVCDDIVAHGGKTPKIKCVVCGLSNAAYRRSDGVFVVPLTCLTK